MGESLTDAPTESVEVLLVWHKRIDKQYIEQFPNLKGVVRYGVGFDVIDLSCLSEKNIVFCNTPDYGTDEVSDTAIAMLMNISRGLSQYDVACRSYDDGTWQENTLKYSRRSSDLTVGVVGAGRIGGSVCLKAKSLGFNVAFFDPYRDSGYEKMLGVDRSETLEELLGLADIVSVHTPLSEKTRGMVDARFLGMMKPGASFINTARGELVKQLNDLYQCLKDGLLQSVALDVLPEEPPSQDSKLIAAWREREPWLDGRLIINPHSAYYSDRAYLEMRSKAAENAKRILNGLTPLNIIKAQN